MKGTPLNGPRTMAFHQGDLYLALREGNAIVRIAPRTATIHHVAGTGVQGYTGDGGPARTASFAGPKGLATGGGGLYVADTENHVIRRIDLASGTVTTVLGTGRRGDGPEPDPLRVRALQAPRRPRRSGGPALRRPTARPIAFVWSISRRRCSTQRCRNRAPLRYDRKAAAYDAVLRWPIYHRVFWGTSPRSFSEFGREALQAAGDGHFAEIGCGSLLFTARMYDKPRCSPAVLLDRSVQMLRRGATRLAAAGSRESAVLLHADAAATPLRSGVCGSILSLNLLHVPCERARIVSEFRRLLSPKRGRLFVSSLILAARWSDRYMALLHRAGELDRPMTLEELRDAVAGGWGEIESVRVEGSMCFLVVRHRG